MKKSSRAQSSTWCPRSVGSHVSLSFVCFNQLTVFYRPPGRRLHQWQCHRSRRWLPNEPRWGVDPIPPSDQAAKRRRWSFPLSPAESRLPWRLVCRGTGGHCVLLIFRSRWSLLNFASTDLAPTAQESWKFIERAEKAVDRYRAKMHGVEDVAMAESQSAVNSTRL
jgi:hypothetical protein